MSITKSSIKGFQDLTRNRTDFIYDELDTLAKTRGELSKEENVERKNTGLGVIEGKVVALKSLAKTERIKGNLLDIIARTAWTILGGTALGGFVAVGFFLFGMLVIPGIPLVVAAVVITLLAAIVGIIGVPVTLVLLKKAGMHRVEWYHIHTLDRCLSELRRLLERRSNAQADQQL